MLCKQASRNARTANVRRRRTTPDVTERAEQSRTMRDWRGRYLLEIYPRLLPSEKFANSSAVLARSSRSDSDRPPLRRVSYQPVWRGGYTDSLLATLSTAMWCSTRRKRLRKARHAGHVGRSKSEFDHALRTGLQQVASAFGIVGFRRFLEGWYIILVTKRKP